MFQEAEYTIKGIAPIIHHSARLADPLSDAAKALKEITSKKKKTDADHAECARREFAGGLVVDADGNPCVSASMIEAMMVQAAKLSREGKEAQRSLFVERDAPLRFARQKDVTSKNGFDVDAAWLARDFFALTVSARVQAARVMRTRPIFRDWSTKIVVIFDDEGFNRAQLDELVRLGGAKIGLGDWRPRYGRFAVVS